MNDLLKNVLEAHGGLARWSFGTVRAQIVTGGRMVDDFTVEPLLVTRCTQSARVSHCHSACNFDPLSRGIGVQN
jgi:hypothetical protein